MKKKYIIWASLLLFFKIRTLAQAGQELHINDMNGIWQNTVDTSQYHFFKNGKSLTFFYRDFSSVANEKINNPFYLGELNTYCFINKLDSLNWGKCKSKGNSEKDFFLWYDVAEFYYEKNQELGDALELETTNVFFYRRRKNLPYEIYKEFFKQSQKDNRDYLKEFLGGNFKEVKSLKSIIYSALHKPTSKYIIRGDIVQIIKQKGLWVNIRYYGNKVTEGWIKKSDVNNP